LIFINWFQQTAMVLEPLMKPVLALGKLFEASVQELDPQIPNGKAFNNSELIGVTLVVVFPLIHH